MAKWLLPILLGFTLYLAVDGSIRAARGDDSVDDIARMYVAWTSTPGYTMRLQGYEKSVECLHPRFVKALAAAIEEARNRGLPNAGVYSACRPPVLGVGGFRDKHQSLHAYGLAVDMAGVGRPGSDNSKLWNEIARRHGLVNPYGWRHGVEWNHYQATWAIGVTKKHPLRTTITADGPIELEETWRVAQSLMIAALGGTMSDAQPVIKTKVKKKKKNKQKAKRKRKR